jgi:hypothetical protein
MRTVRLLFLVSLLAVSCSEGPGESMQRLVRDPVPEPPRVVSFREEQNIDVSWKEEPAADSYILYRAEDTPLPLPLVFYRGSATSFRDSGVENQGRYLYSLSCVKEGREFGPSSPSFGVGSYSIRDLYEENDSKISAAPIRYEVEANVYHYRDSFGNTLEDVDWYSLEVPPRHTAYLALTQEVPSLEGETETFLYFLREGSGVKTRIINGRGFPLVNYSYLPETILLQISPVSAACSVEPGLGGGTVIEYTLRLIQTVAF